MAILLLSNLIRSYSTKWWGEAADAQIISVWEKPDNNDQSAYQVKYQYQHRIELFHGTLSISKEEYQQISEGASRSMTIKYSRAHPAFSLRPEPDRGEFGGVLACVLWLMLPSILFLIALASAGQFLNLIGTVSVACAIS